MAIYALGGLVPKISATAFVHPDAVVIGNVTIDDNASIWPCVVLRGDGGAIHIGERSSVQDGTIVHCTSTDPTIVGPDCVVGHNVHLEGCTIEQACLIASSSTVLNGAIIKTGSIVAAGALVREKSVVGPGVMVAGIPATERGPTNEKHRERIKRGAEDYVKKGILFGRELRRLDR